MREKVRLTIDGRRVAARKGQTILEVAREVGIEIPTLCYHDAVSPVGACRICVVESTMGGRTRTVASCVTPVADGMVVKTNTEKIKKIRRMIATLLLARCPNVEVIKELANRLGVKKVPFPKEDNDCFLCGLCVRACQEIVGVGAIDFAFRGPQMEVAPPFGQQSNVCIGCGTCTTICPARSFDLEKVFARRNMHVKDNLRTLYKCSVCDDHYVA